MRLHTRVAPFNRTHLLLTCRARPEQALLEWRHAFIEGLVRFPRGYTHAYDWDGFLRSLEPYDDDPEEWQTYEDFLDEFAIPVAMNAQMNEILARVRGVVSLRDHEIRYGRKGYPRLALEALLQTLPRCREAHSASVICREIEALLPQQNTRDIEFPCGIC
jgi:hypothetical protein